MAKEAQHTEHLNIESADEITLQNYLDPEPYKAAKPLVVSARDQYFEVPPKPTQDERRDKILNRALWLVGGVLAVGYLTPMIALVWTGKVVEAAEFAKSQMGTLFTILSSIISFYAGSRLRKK